MVTEFNREQMLGLLRDFNLLTGIRICLFDIDFNELLAFPEEQPDYCLKIRGEKGGIDRCRASDEAALSTARRTGGFFIYSCHAGFTEAVCPIRHEGQTLGYLMFGHVKHGFSPEQVRAAAGIMESCAGYIYLSRLVQFKDGALERRLGEYLAENISGDLSVDTLCRVLKVSRVALYSLFSRLYGSSPAAHVRALRLERACKLLTTTGKKIAFVASESGFADYNYFAKQFKRQYGISPGRFRASKI